MGKMRKDASGLIQCWYQMYKADKTYILHSASVYQVAVVMMSVSFCRCAVGGGIHFAVVVLS